MPAAIFGRWPLNNNLSVSRPWFTCSSCCAQDYPLDRYVQLLEQDRDVIYIHAYFVYNISMNVKTEQKPIERLRMILREQNGILFTSDLAKLGIPRTYLSILEATGEIQKVSRGVYSAVNSMADEMAGLQVRYKRAIFSHETALYFLELSDRTPLFYSVTVPAGYNATLLKASGAKVYFVKRELHLLGESMAKTPNGNEIKTYNLERTICDILRSRNQMDIQFINEALKRYVRKKEKNIDLLYSYAQQFRIQKIVRATIEVLL
ncbi:MAG TPA: abortive phage infection protein [Anaerolineaceae bacterium]|nr:abortive phage infection protein [Anaerolineaceae bacterium]